MKPCLLLPGMHVRRKSDSTAPVLTYVTTSLRRPATYVFELAGEHVDVDHWHLAHQYERTQLTPAQIAQRAFVEEKGYGCAND